MSFKKKLRSLLFNSAPETETEEPKTAESAPAAEPAPAEPSAEPQNPALLTLPQEHPMYQLFHLRQKEAGQLPEPRICLDEDGVLPPDLMKKEAARLRTVLNQACNVRLKALRKKNAGPADKQKPKGKGGDKNAEKNAEKNTEKGADKNKPAKEDAPVSLDALPCFFLSLDKLYAWVFILPPTGGGAELTSESLRRAMAQNEITFGVDSKLVNRLPREKHRYFKLYRIAEGKRAFDGENGNIVDNFPRVLEWSLEANEYDQVDYTALNLICNVKEGDEICRAIKPTEGEPGRTVTDQEVPAKSGKSVPLPKGKNTDISEDGDSLLAAISGHLEFTGHCFQVKPVLDIPGDVDFSTGNIKFLGDVNIKGDILSGFSVRAMGNIQVGGVVESGTVVEAGGDLLVSKGIVGDGSTIIRVQRNLLSKYVENSTVYVRENLQTDGIINGQVYCDGEVQVRSGRGSIMGGRVWAAKLVTAKVVGSRSECRTAISLGGLPCSYYERETVQRELKELELEAERLEAQMDSPVKSSLMGKVRLKLSAAELKLKQLEDDLMEIQAEMSEQEKEAASARLECGTVYAGTEISFGDNMIRLRHEHRQCVVRLSDGEIVVS